MKGIPKIKISWKDSKKILKKYKPLFKWEEIGEDFDEALLFASEIGSFILASGIALMFPDSRSYGKIIRHRDEILDLFPKYRLQHSLKYSQTRRLVTKKVEADWQLTSKGEQKAINFLLQKLFVAIPKKWDGKWRIVVFDVPTGLDSKRDFLRYYLKKFGFLNIQQSVWVFPFDCHKEINFLIDLIKVRSFVYFMDGQINDEDKILYYFKKKFSDVIWNK